ncbi:MAG: hypothetical protein AAFV43_12440 [Planctomycetota bacterium]
MTVVVAQPGSVSSFIEPDWSTTKTMSLGFAIEMADASVVNCCVPMTRAKKSASSVRVAVTRTALPITPPPSGVKTSAAASQTPSSTVVSASWINRPPASWRVV